MKSIFKTLQLELMRKIILPTRIITINSGQWIGQIIEKMNKPQQVNKSLERMEPCCLIAVDLQKHKSVLKDALLTIEIYTVTN